MGILKKFFQIRNQERNICDMTMMIMMIIITFCALDILILEFLPCKWQLVWNMLIKIIIIKITFLSAAIFDFVKFHFW